MCQNVSDEALLAWFKFQAKIPMYSGVCVQGQRQKYTPPSPPLSKVKGLRDIGHKMSIGNLFLGAYSVTVSYLIHYLIQYATDIITKRESYFVTKCNKDLLQNASGFLLQNATVLLQNMTVITKRDDFITKCDVYYKLRQYSVQYLCMLSWFL